MTPKRSSKGIKASANPTRGEHRTRGSEVAKTVPSIMPRLVQIVKEARGAKLNTPTTTQVLATVEQADLLLGMHEDETQDIVFEWREELVNGYPRDLRDGHKVVRALNNFSLVNNDGFLCQPDAPNFERCASNQEVHLVGWVTPLSVGPKRFFRVVSGWWPPAEWSCDSDNNDTVWRMNALVLRIRVREIYWGRVKVYGRLLEGLFAPAWNNKVEYWLQHPATEYETLHEAFRSKHPQIYKRKFKDLDISKPNDGKMHPWVLKMLRLETGLAPVCPADHPFKYEAECSAAPEWSTDAESIATNDESAYPTGSNWRTTTFQEGNSVIPGTDNNPIQTDHDGDDGTDDTDDDAEGEEESSMLGIPTRIHDATSRPPKRQRTVSSVSPPTSSTVPLPVTTSEESPKLEQEQNQDTDLPLKSGTNSPAAAQTCAFSAGDTPESVLCSGSKSISS